MFLKIVGLSFLVAVVSAAQEGTRKQRRGSMESKLSSVLNGKFRAAMDKKAHRLADVDHLRIYGHERPASHATARWQPEVNCPPGSFVNAYKEWEDVTPGDHQGLTHIELRCMKASVTSCGSSDCTWIVAGKGRDTPWGVDRYMGEQKCPHSRQFLTGVQGLFGGVSRGAWKLLGTCDVPDWESTPEAKAGELKPHYQRLGILPAAGTHMSQDLHSGDPIVFWEVQPKTPLKCPAGRAVCGIKVKIDPEDSPVRDDTGINELELICCPFSLTITYMEGQ